MTERNFGVAEGVSALLTWSLILLLGAWLLLLLLRRAAGGSRRGYLPPAC